MLLRLPRYLRTRYLRCSSPSGREKGETSSVVLVSSSHRHVVREREREREREKFIDNQIDD